MGETQHLVYLKIKSNIQELQNSADTITIYSFEQNITERKHDLKIKFKNSKSQKQIKKKQNKKHCEKLAEYYFEEENQGEKYSKKQKTAKAAHAKYRKAVFRR